VHLDYEAKYHQLEEGHWWFRARRDAVFALLLKIRPHRSSRILEIGCSSGVLLRRLAREGYESVVGIDISEEAIAVCHVRGTTNARTMDAQALDFAENSFDVITASDVLEHLRDDEKALHEWARVLSPGGHALIFVPAFRGLWSEHDVANQHFRRYRVAELAAKAEAAGFVIERRSYWNTMLLPPIALIRAMKRMARNKSEGVVDSDLFPPPAPMNQLLYLMLTCENKLLLRGVNLPFGVSAMIIARKLP
jgi:ubiquinone/menaquinone biosynthesis C-methylase UbiE